MSDEIEWTPDLEAARLDLCAVLVATADDPHCMLAHVDLSKRLLEAEQALTILGDIANRAVPELARLRAKTDTAVTVGLGLNVYGSYDAIKRVQTYIMLDSSHPIERVDTRRILMRGLEAAERRIGELETAIKPFADAAATFRPDDADSMKPAIVAAGHFRRAAFALGAAVVDSVVEELTCIACGRPFAAGEPYRQDISGGAIHAACCGPERESYVDLDSGEPLTEGEPIPPPDIWPDAADPLPFITTPDQLVPVRPIGFLIRETRPGRLGKPTHSAIMGGRLFLSWTTASAAAERLNNSWRTCTVVPVVEAAS